MVADADAVKAIAWRTAQCFPDVELYFITTLLHVVAAVNIWIATVQTIGEIASDCSCCSTYSGKI